jgi:hypothetical protein
MRHPLSVGLLGFCIALFAVLQVWKSTAPVGVSDWNGKAVSKIITNDPNNFSFAIFGDNKDGYALFDALLHDIDKRNEVSFAIALGDLVPRGGRKEFRMFIGELQDDLDIPLAAVIGNHDLENGSSKSFREVFGNTYYRFSIGGNEFIVLDAATESGLGPVQRKWLEAVLASAQDSNNRFVFMHVPPFDPRGKSFAKHLQDGPGLMVLFRRYHVTHLFAGHIHGYFSGVWEGIPYTISGGGGARLQSRIDPAHRFHHYLVAHVRHGNVDLQPRPFNADLPMRIADFFEDHPAECGLMFPLAFALVFLISAFKRP